MAINRQPVSSTNIAFVGYDTDARKLTIEFKSGTKYQYDDVSPEAHAALMAAESVGKHFHANIRNAHESKKVE